MIKFVYKRKCKRCGAAFETTQRRRVFCTDRCREKYYSKKERENRALNRLNGIRSKGTLASMSPEELFNYGKHQKPCDPKILHDSNPSDQTDFDLFYRNTEKTYGVEITPELSANMQDLREKGCSFVEIEQKCGIPRMTAKQFLTDIGVCEERTWQVERRLESDSLCWWCALSALGDVSPCSWHRKAHVPRDDWEAEQKNLFTATGETIESYLVKSCPAFVRG